MQDLIEEFEIDNPSHGTLTRTLMEDTIPADNGTGIYPFETTKVIIEALSAVMKFQFTVNDVLRDLRFKVPLEIEKKYPILQDAEFVQISGIQNLNAPEFAFRTLVDYYVFLLLHFIAAKPNVEKVVEEFDRAKQRMYKRYERATAANKKASDKDLTYAEYYEWLEEATAARDDCLAGKISEEDALAIIKKY